MAKTAHKDRDRMQREDDKINAQVSLIWPSTLNFAGKWPG